MKSICHTEATHVAAIHRLAKESRICRVAVSYCGKHAYEFFPEALSLRPEDLRIIVDASEGTVAHGLTNPAGLTSLLGLTRQMRSVKGLHAKVFIFDDRSALVGSTNLSRSSLAQYQMTLEMSDRSVVKELVNWFDAHWQSGRDLDPDEVDRLEKLWRAPQATTVAHKKIILPQWHERPNPPPRSQFKIALKGKTVVDLLSQFKRNECPYGEIEGASCLETADFYERKYQAHGKTLHALMRRQSGWTHNDLGGIFAMAYMHGRPAKMRRPLFVKQSQRKVAKSLNFLLNGNGDPYVRFEKVLATGSPYKLNGLGAAGAIFLMHLWNSSEFALVNAPIVTALRILKVAPTLSGQKGQAFKDLTAAVKQIAQDDETWESCPCRSLSGCHCETAYLAEHH
jgi:hypothetical protein